MYGREIDGQLHTFGVSGKLIMNALVMYDHQTETLWSQFLRKGVKGPLTGSELDVVPVTQTTWSSWVQLHPDTRVLDKRGSYRRDTYSGYYSGGSAGVIGETNSDQRLDRKELVLGVDAMGETKAYPLRRLEAVEVLNDTFAGNELLVFFDRTTGTALAYDRVVDGTPLTFRVEEGTFGPDPPCRRADKHDLACVYRAGGGGRAGGSDPGPGPISPILLVLLDRLEPGHGALHRLVSLAR